MSETISQHTVSRRLQILFLTSSLVTPDQPGSLRSWLVACQLAKRGHRVDVVATDTNHLTGQPAAWTGSKMPAGSAGRLRVHFVPTLKNYRYARFGRVRQMVGLGVRSLLVGIRAHRPDVVLAAMPPPTVPLAGILLSIAHRSKFVYEIRDLQVDDAVALGYLRNPLLILIARAVEILFCHAADAIIAVTPGIKRAMVARGIDERKITVVTNGYDEDLYANPSAPRNPRTEHGWGERFVVIFTGALGKTGEHRTILEAARLLRDEQEILFVLVGDGEQRAPLQRLSEQWKLQNCQFLGVRLQADIPRYCAAANAGVSIFPTEAIWDHALGGKTFCYLGSGIPMIFGGGGDTADLLRAAQSGIVIPPQDPIALVNAIRILKDDPGLAQAMGRRGRNYIAQHYDRRAITDRLVDVIERTASRQDRAN